MDESIESQTDNNDAIRDSNTQNTWMAFIVFLIAMQSMQIKTSSRTVSVAVG